MHDPAHVATRARRDDILATKPPEPNEPRQGRIAELERTATQVQARLRRQILNLEDDLGAETAGQLDPTQRRTRPRSWTH